MNPKVYLFIIFIFIHFCCNSKRNETNRDTRYKKGTTSAKSQPQNIIIDLDHFADSLSIWAGEEKYLLKIDKTSTTNHVSFNTIVRFFHLKKNVWVETSSYTGIELTGDFFEPYLKDFNGDGVADLQLSIGTGMRGGNEIFHLFFTDTVHHRLVKAKGIETIVNPLYDSSTRRITSMTLIGSGSIFSDYEIIRGDSLIRTDESELWVDRGMTFQRKTFFNRSGKIIRVVKDSVRDGGESRFSPW